MDKNHVQFQDQPFPTQQCGESRQVDKNLKARELFPRRAGIDRRILMGEIWNDGCFESTGGIHGDEDAIASYPVCLQRGSLFANDFSMRDYVGALLR
jgi:hypothetical protein